MKTVTKIILASTLVLSAAAPASAYETALEFQTQVLTTGTSAQHLIGQRVRAHRSINALNARAHVPTSAPAVDDVDFGVGSQH